jgi:hypothetical protein
MTYYQLGDLVHPDTLNLLLEVAGLARIRVPLLHHKDGDDWVVIVPAHPVAPALRRLHWVDGGWRHFPMTGWAHHDAPDEERVGTPVELPSLDATPTWLCEAAFAADNRLRPQLDFLCQCLDALAFFPRYPSLAGLAARLRVHAAATGRRSRDLADLLFAARLEFAGGGQPPQDYPAATELFRAVEDMLAAIGRADIEIGPPDRVTAEWVKQVAALFDSTSVFVGTGHGAPIDRVENWGGKRKVRLVPRRDVKS